MLGSKAVIVSVSTLGSRGKSVATVAGQIVGYLEGRQEARGGPDGGTLIELPAPDGGIVAYYADSAGEGPGRWWGQGAEMLGLAGDVVGEDLFWLLQGKHHETREPLIEARGSAGRANRASSGRTVGRDFYTTRQAATVTGTSVRYVRQLCEAGEEAAVLRVCQLLAGVEMTERPRRYLVGERHGKGGRWRIAGDELAGFVADRRAPTVVAGHDVTFSVEKSVSALWAGADDPVRVEIIAAVDASVGAGMSYLECNAAFIRVNGKRVPAVGLTAASYLHSTSRALDPQLHRHVVVANFAADAEGRVRTVDSTALYQHAKTAGYLASAELRHQLTARLGVQWQPVANGLADVAGVPAAAIDELSKRRREIDEAAAELAGVIGVDSAEARQVLVLQTRAAKRHGVDAGELRRTWIETLDRVGFGPDLRARCLRRTPGPLLVTDVDVAGLFAALSGGGPDSMTHLAATFDRRMVIQKMAEWSRDRLSAVAVEALADQWLSTADVVPVNPPRAVETNTVIRRGDGRVVITGRDQLYTTFDMVRVEERLLRAYRTGREASRAVVPTGIVDEVLARPGFSHLSAEQQTLVRHMTTAGHEVGLVRGPAGTGKTVALEAAARAWEAAGWRVQGASVNGAAAERLGIVLGVESTTIAGLLTRVGYGDDQVIGERTVVVVDEATTLGTRELDQLVSEVHDRGAGLWLVGDPAQHSAVTAGGAFRVLLEQWPQDVAELSEVRRQVGPEMAELRLALADYRNGLITQALERLERDDRIVVAESTGGLLDQLVADWYVDRGRAALDPGFTSGSMTAARHDERRQLVARARLLLQEDGTLTGPVFHAAGMVFQAGDEVVAKKADREIRPDDDGRRSFIRNGTRGQVVEVSDDALVVDFEHRGPVTVPRSYIEQEIAPGIRGGLLHSYALTTHTAQGDTYGAARHLGSTTSTRAEIYVGLTRGRYDVRLYVLDRARQTPHPVDDEMPRLTTQTDTARALASSLRKGPERLATELAPTLPAVDRLAREFTLRELLEHRTAAGGETAPLYEQAVRVRADRIATAAIAEPDETILPVLGPRPSVGPARQAWDEAVAAVAVFGDVHPTRPVGSLGPVGQLVGIRPGGDAGHDWDVVADAVRAIRPIEQAVPVPLPDLTPDF